MNCGIAAVKKTTETGGMPGNARKNAKFAGNRRMASIDSLPEWKRREIVAEQIVDAASRIKMPPLTRKEIDAWAGRLLDANTGRDNHSC